MEGTVVFGLLLGVAATWSGAELLVRGSSRLAFSLGIPPLIIGLTVVALGTSSPEAVVSFVAAAKGSAGIALGNILGSNVANIGLILGVVTLVHPLRVVWSDLRRDYAYLVGATLLALVLIAADGLGWPAGLLLLGLLAVVFVDYVRRGARAPVPVGELLEEVERVATPSKRALAGLMTVVGLGLLILGARWLVSAAEDIARAFGLGEELIGATIVAVGTSLPELAASLVAALRGEHEIGIGNILGSNLMNLLFVLGGVGVVAPRGVVYEGSPVLLVVVGVFTIALGLMLRFGGRIGRRKGAGLLLAYAVFAVWAYF